MVRARARVDVGAIERNCARLATTVAPARLCAVVKADGYGHGAVPAARAAQAGGAAWLAVATAGEAAALRAAGIDGPLLVMGALSDEELPVAIGAGADVVAWREAFVAKLGPEARVHVKLDTGMGRLGTRDPDEASRVAAAAGDRLPRPMTRFAPAAEGGRTVLGGAPAPMTPSATADEDDPTFLDAQLAAFAAWIARHPGVPVHAANSAAALRRPDARFDLVRCGIPIYSLEPLTLSNGA